ncbi:hypothetical protein CDAR_252091 [Caerostris darwini]|uniref:Uncharacterized protein n=1 Tax=Caerostris darwini TaxID=1538125 RepID=A0AAV4N753_9ARAC|nr:hypothetical protein CDAR_252091 [Caerostris darwini]
MRTFPPKVLVLLFTYQTTYIGKPANHSISTANVKGKIIYWVYISESLSNFQILASYSCIIKLNEDGKKIDFSRNRWLRNVVLIPLWPEGMLTRRPET